MDVLGLLLQTLNEIIDVAPSVQSATSHANFTSRMPMSEKSSFKGSVVEAIPPIETDKAILLDMET